MEQYSGVAIVTLLCSLMVLGMAVKVAKTHAKTGLLVPTMTGDPLLERTIRAHMNTIEWMPLFLPSMWMFAIYWSASWATGLGCVWLLARIAYFIGYISAPSKRMPGFFIQAFTTLALLLGAIGRIGYLAVS